jgi:hypothetical protein
MDDNDDKCGAVLNPHEGSITCSLPKGHEGLHHASHAIGTLDWGDDWSKNVLPWPPTATS